MVIQTMVVLMHLVGGNIAIDDAFPFGAYNVSINDAFQDCNKNKKPWQKCLLAQQRDPSTLVFSNVETGQQYILRR